MFKGNPVDRGDRHLVCSASEHQKEGNGQPQRHQHDGLSYRHGEFKFSMPVQVSVREATRVDNGLIAALNAASVSSSPTIERLRSALPFVELANTDDDLVTENAEAILMGSAFEQLLAGDASSYKLGRKFGVLFGKCGSVTVGAAKASRPDIELDTSDPARAASQLTWWVHRKWMEELYDVRSKVVHKGTHSTRRWGWTLSEHLVMAAMAFPVVVKIMLQREGHYALSDEDGIRCRVVDKLLGIVGWDQTDPGEDTNRWNSIVSAETKNQMFQTAMAKAGLKYP